MVHLLMFLMCWLATRTTAELSFSADDGRRIVGGKETRIQEFPFQVSLQMYNEHFCGASIIHTSWALSAAHCFRVHFPNITRGVSGATFFKSEGKSHRISKVITHPEYNGTNNDNDAALLKVYEPFVESNVVKVIDLAEKTPPVGTSVRACGWGFLNEGDTECSQQLHGVDVVIMDHDFCEKVYGTQKFTSNMLCAGDPNGIKDTCKGDSGGGLSTFDNKLVGIVSWGKRCGLKDFPGVYTDVARIRNWIVSTIESN